MLGMLRGLKSSWTVPAGTTAAAGLAGGVAGVGATVCRVGWGAAVVTTGAEPAEETPLVGDMPQVPVMPIALETVHVRVIKKAANKPIE